MKAISQLSILALALMLAGCEIIGDIFSAGFYTALILVLIVVIVVVWIIIRVRRR